jgi:hypothetical protein
MVASNVFRISYQKQIVVLNSLYNGRETVIARVAMIFHENFYLNVSKNELSENKNYSTD